MSILKKILGSKNERELRRLRPIVSTIGGLEPAIKKLTDVELKAKTGELRGRVEKGEPLDRVLPEAFAVVREAGWRVLKMRHFDVQLIGGMVLHSGKIAEMRTGEGKTLVATLPAYLNALTGKGVHVVTVNDYLANRDAEWMGKIYRFLGMEVGTIVHGFGDAHKKRQYAADITYGTNSEFGFDYLRDNMKMRLSEYVQGRGLHYAIIDEVDSVLIDEARTPLIISGQADEATERYIEANRVVEKLQVERDYTLDEKSKSAVLTDEGNDRVERALKVDNLYAPDHVEWLHHITKALQAHACYKRDKEYIVREGEVIIIDENLGREMPGRRWSDGLHQAIEAKEGVPIQPESMTLATITYQNLYRMYGKLSGMTGTADTEAEEFHKIYNLDVVVIPTNRSMVRKDSEDLVYKTEAEKFAAVVDDIKTRHERGQPVLVGTRSVDKSEVLSRLLNKNGIEHTVLNAKLHRREGEIIAQAGQYRSVTISTNMAGRGTDILLGGNPEYLARADVAREEAGSSSDPEKEQRILAEFRFLSGSPDSVPIETLTKEYAEKLFRERLGQPAPEAEQNLDVAQVRELRTKEAREYITRLVTRYADHLHVREAECKAAKEKVLAAGGLHVLGTERHEARRVDNQLRGRAGRQGDPGSSQFYLSLEDDLMRMFGGDRLVKMMDRLGMEDGVPIEAGMVTKSILGAQKRVEGHNFDIRKNLIEYDDVLNQQRKSIYALRRRVLGDEPLEDELLDMIDRVICFSIEQFCPVNQAPEEWDLDGLEKRIFQLLDMQLPKKKDELGALRPQDMATTLYDAAERHYESRTARLGADWVVVGEDLVPKVDLPVTAKVKEPVHRFILRQVYLEEIDAHWREHLTRMDHLKEGIHLRGYGQRDPKIEYKKEGFEFFDSMLREIDHNVTSRLFHAQLVTASEWMERQRRQRMEAEALLRRAELAGEPEGDAGDSVAATAPEAEQSKGNGAGGDPKKVGRNDPCWCGSGKKYKKCHLPIDSRASSRV